MPPMCLQGQARFQLYQKLAALVFALVQVTMGCISALSLLSDWTVVMSDMIMPHLLCIYTMSMDGCRAGGGPAVVHPAVRG
jgi:hypothetical protein